MMNSTLAALEAAFPLERILCRGCGYNLYNVGLGKTPSNCPVCGLLAPKDNQDGDKSAQSDR